MAALYSAEPTTPATLRAPPTSVFVSKKMEHYADRTVQHTLGQFCTVPQWISNSVDQRLAVSVPKVYWKSALQPELHAKI